MNSEDTGWKKVKLRDLIDVKHGFSFKGNYFVDHETEWLLLTPGNFVKGGGFQNPKPKYYDGPVPEDYVLSQSDLLITMTDLSRDGGTLGYPLLVPRVRNKKLLHNQRLGKITIKNPNSLNKDLN